MATPVKSFRPAPIVTEVAARNGGGKGLSHRLAQIADRYSELLWHAVLPELSEAELSLLRDANNGTLHEPAALLRGSIAMGVADAIALDGLDTKWGVDGDALVAKLRDLTFLQEVRLIEDLEAWWAKADARGA